MVKCLYILNCGYGFAHTNQIIYLNRRWGFSLAIFTIASPNNPFAQLNQGRVYVPTCKKNIWLVCSLWSVQRMIQSKDAHSDLLPTHWKTRVWDRCCLSCSKEKITRTGSRRRPRKSRSKMEGMGYMNVFWHLRFAWMNLDLPSPPETSATQHLVPPMHNDFLVSGMWIHHVMNQALTCGPPIPAPLGPSK
jgi:hypothetical protein